MKDLSHLFETIPMRTDRVGACAQLEDELLERGFAVSEGPSNNAIWCEPQPGSLHGFWVYGETGLSVHIQPNKGSNKRVPYWMIEYTLYICVKHDSTDPLRVNRLHAQSAQILRKLGFRMTEEEEILNGIDGASEHESQWSHACDTVSKACDIIVALRSVEASQYPDGDLWMGGDYPAPEPKLEEPIAEEDPPVRTGCPRVVASGDWYWIPGVCEYSPIHLVGPCGEMAATVYQSGCWVAHRLCGGVKDEGESATIKGAMMGAKRAAMKGYGQNSKARRRRAHQ